MEESLEGDMTHTRCARIGLLLALLPAVGAAQSAPLVYEYVNPFKGMPLSYWDTLPEPEEAAAREAAFLRAIRVG